MSNNFLLSFTLALALILQFSSPASAVNENCPKSMKILTKHVSDMEEILKKCENIDKEKGWSNFCEVNIDSQAASIATAVKQAYNDCGQVKK